jgi:hypothetical protein
LSGTPVTDLMLRGLDSKQSVLSELRLAACEKISNPLLGRFPHLKVLHLSYTQVTDEFF